MSDTDHGNPAPGGQESLVGEVAAWGRAAGAEDAVIHDSGPHGDRDDAAGVVGVAGAMGSLGEEARAVGVPEGSILEEDSDIGPADEEEENVEQGPEVAVNAYQFPMAGFRFMFLNLVRTLLHRLYYNDHILVRPRGTGRIVWSRHPRPRQGAEIHVLLGPEASGEGAAATVPEASGEGAAATVPEASGEGAAALEPKDQAKAQEESAAAEMEEELVLEAEDPQETTKYQYENSEEEAQDAESNEEKEEFNKKQEGPQKDEESAESSLEE